MPTPGTKLVWRAILGKRADRQIDSAWLRKTLVHGPGYFVSGLGIATNGIGQMDCRSWHQSQYSVAMAKEGLA